MQSTNRKRALIVSAAVILLCMTAIAGMTWALFTDTQTVENHLQAGDMKITLKRTELTKTTLDSKGYLTTLPADTTPVNFTNPKDDNVFGLEDGEKIVPGTKYAATMQIENHGDVAFGYWIEVKCTDKSAGEALAKQLKVTVTTDKDITGFVGDGLTVTGADGGNVGAVAIGETANFTVTVEFLDSAIAENGIADNNLAQEQKLDFDLVVHAVQLTQAPTP